MEPNKDQEQKARTVMMLLNTMINLLWELYPKELGAVAAADDDAIKMKLAHTFNQMLWPPQEPNDHFPF